MEGMEAVKFANGEPPRKRSKEELEEIIRATQLYIFHREVSKYRWKPKCIPQYIIYHLEPLRLYSSFYRTSESFSHLLSHIDGALV